MAGDRTYRIAVENGEVSGIQPTPTESDKVGGADLFAVPALLAAAGRWWIDDEHTEVDFDDKLGYIARVRQDDPKLVDDEFTLKITDFQIDRQ